METILCAAICDPTEKDMQGKPLIYCGHRHAPILWQGRHVSRDPYHQGFLTSTGRFVDRKEAYEIARSAGQVELGAKLFIHGQTELYSEDLY